MSRSGTRPRSRETWTPRRCRCWRRCNKRMRRLSSRRLTASPSLSYLFPYSLELPQGRVWTGRQALAVGLVDSIGGLWSAINLAKQSANLADDQPVRIEEMSRTKMSPLASALQSTVLPFSSSSVTAASAGLFESESLPQYSLGKLYTFAGAKRVDLEWPCLSRMDEQAWRNLPAKF